MFAALILLGPNIGDRCLGCRAALVSSVVLPGALLSLSPLLLFVGHWGGEGFRVRPFGEGQWYMIFWWRVLRMLGGSFFFQRLFPRSFFLLGRNNGVHLIAVLGVLSVIFQFPAGMGTSGEGTATSMIAGIGVFRLVCCWWVFGVLRIVSELRRW